MKYQLPLLLLCMLSLVVLPLLAQSGTDNPPPPVTTQAPPAAETPAPEENAPPLEVSRPRFNDTALPTRSVTERWLSVGILLFGALVVAGMLFAIIKRVKIEHTSDLTEALKLPVVVVILVSVVFLVTAGYSSEELAPVVGFLGTIAGYLMGRNTR